MSARLAAVEKRPAAPPPQKPAPARDAPPAAPVSAGGLNFDVFDPVDDGGDGGPSDGPR
eukprot:gene4741-5720_t